MKRERAYKNSQRKNSTSNSYSYSSRRNDSYDVYNYDDPDDFADDWAEKFGGGELVEGKYISNSLWNDSLLVKYFEFGYNDACISSGADC